MRIRRANGACNVLQGKKAECLAAAGKNLHQLQRRNDFQLGVSTVAWFFVSAPPSKLRHVAKAGALHVLIGDLHYKFGAQRLPR